MAVLLKASLPFLVIAAVKLYPQRYIYTDLQKTPAAPTALILGAGLQKGREPSVYLRDRLDKGIELYQAGKVKTILISGDHGIDGHDEITPMFNYLTRNSVPAQDIVEDRSGYNTYTSMYRAKNVYNLEEFIVVTQAYHLPRAVFICRMQDCKCYGAVADKSKYSKYKYNYMREYIAILKSCWDLAVKANPKTK